MIRVTVWNEFFHEQQEGEDHVRAIYPEGIHNYIKGFLDEEEDFEVRTATFYDGDDCGLSQEVIDNTDVLIWWAHMLHWDVPMEVVTRVQHAVLNGMGIIFLHSAHLSMPFTTLMGTTGRLSWRDGDTENVWVVDPSHPIAKGIGKKISLPIDEVYSEPFGIPEPDKLVFIGTYGGGEVFRSGCCWHKGYGNIFYFQPGHEEYPVYHDKDIQQVIKNAVRWCEPTLRVPNNVACTPIE